MSIGVVGMIVLISTSNQKLRYGFAHIALIGAGTSNPLVAAWITDNTPEKATRAVIFGFYAIGNLSGIITGQIFKSRYAPSYRIPLMATMIIVCVGVVGVFVVRFCFMWENRRRARMMAGWNDEDFEREKADAARRGHQKVFFVYGY
jgi:MFS family permease